MEEYLKLLPEEISPQKVVNNVKYKNPILQEQCIIFASLGSHYLKQLIKHNNLNYKVEVKRYVLDDSIPNNSEFSQYHYYIEVNTNTEFGKVIMDNVWYYRKYYYLRDYCPKGIKKITQKEIKENISMVLHNITSNIRDAIRDAIIYYFQNMQIEIKEEHERAAIRDAEIAHDDLIYANKLSILG
jgi:hypothetical protein